MTQEVIYTCDKCKKIIDRTQSPIMVVTVIIQDVKRDFCSTKCVKQWTKEDLEKKIRTYE